MLVSRGWMGDGSAVVRDAQSRATEASKAEIGVITGMAVVTWRKGGVLSGVLSITLKSIYLHVSGSIVK